MSIRSQLAKLVKTISGSDATSKTTAGLIGEINTAMSEGGGSSGGDTFFVGGSFGADGQSGILDKTAGEILAACSAGKLVFGHIPTYNNVNVAYLTTYADGEETKLFDFSSGDLTLEFTASTDNAYPTFGNYTPPEEEDTTGGI